MGYTSALNAASEWYQEKSVDRMQAGFAVSKLSFPLYFALCLDTYYISLYCNVLYFFKFKLNYTKKSNC